MSRISFRVIDSKPTTSAPVVAMAMDEVLWQLIQLLIEDDIIAKKDLASRIDRVVTSRISNDSPVPADTAALAATLQQVARALD
jgi:hypothetical protein